jgi:hypothetical protein
LFADTPATPPPLTVRLPAIHELFAFFQAYFHAAFHAQVFITPPAIFLSLSRTAISRVRKERGSV